MASEFHTSAYINTDWAPGKGKIKLIAFDFDKTITRKHTQGAVQLPGQCTPEFIDANFADLEFFRFVVPFIKAQNCEVGVASFGEDQPDAILSGLTLIRAYLDHAFGKEKSQDMIADDMIAVWHPEQKGKDAKKVGKADHLQFLADAFAKNGKGKVGKGNMALFDDDKNNIELGQKAGYQVHYCKALSGKAEGLSGFNREVWKDFIVKKGVSSKGCVIM
eukprot:gene13978-6715_t